MKTKNYMLAFVILMICAVPLCVYGAEPAEPNASNPEHDSKRILKSKVEAEQINNIPNKHKEGTSHIENDKESLIMKIWQMQYTQLLEVHRSYFTVFLQVLAIYLAVMGACLGIVSDSITKMKRDPKEGSKTVLIILAIFPIVTSYLFFAGLLYGTADAIERNEQIVGIEENMEIVDMAGKVKIEHISVKLFQHVILAMSIVTVLIILGWLIIFIRSLMACGKQLTKLSITVIIVTGLLIIPWFAVFIQSFTVYGKQVLLITIVGTILIIIGWVVMFIWGLVCVKQ